jgi:hypothetical protein
VRSSIPRPWGGTIQKIWTRAGLLGLLCVSTVLVRPDEAEAADVRGQLLLASAPPPIAASKPPRAAYNWELENGVKEVLPDRTTPRELAVVLVGGASAAATDRIEVSISGGALMPSTLVVRSNSTVRIKNDDEIGHELFAPGLDGFSPEATSPGATRSVHLTKAGSWPLQDRLAVHARAYLHVLANLAASARLDATGSYAFNDVAPGKYTLKVFRGPDELVSKEIEVTEKTLTVDPLALGKP